MYGQFLFYLLYVLLQYSYYKKETTSFIFVKPNFFICKQFITGTVSWVTVLYCVHPGLRPIWRIHLLQSVKWDFYAILLLVSCSFIFVISITSKHLLCIFSFLLDEWATIFCINASIMNPPKINPSSAEYNIIKSNSIPRMCLWFQCKTTSDSKSYCEH